MVSVTVDERVRIEAVVVEALRRHGVAGATVLLGVDGTVGGVRRRARLFATNAQVPSMIIAVGTPATIAAAVAELRTLMPEPLVTLERVRVCKRDGRRLAEPEHVSRRDADGLGVWQKLMVFCGEQSRHDRRPLAGELVRALRVAGTTVLRGVWATTATTSRTATGCGSCAAASRSSP